MRLKCTKCVWHSKPQRFPAINRGVHRGGDEGVRTPHQRRSSLIDKIKHALQNTRHYFHHAVAFWQHRECTKFVFGRGFPRPPSWFKGVLLLGEAWGKGRKGQGTGGRSEGRRREGRAKGMKHREGKENRNTPLRQFLRTLLVMNTLPSKSRRQISISKYNSIIVCSAGLAYSPTLPLPNTEWSISRR